MDEANRNTCLGFEARGIGWLLSEPSPCQPYSSSSDERPTPLFPSTHERANCPDFANHAEEVGAALARARAALPEGCPVFLMGESMGAPCAVQHLLSEGVDNGSVDGLILCGGLIQVAPGVLPPRVRLTWQTSMACPNRVPKRI